MCVWGGGGGGTGKYAVVAGLSLFMEFWGSPQAKKCTGCCTS